MISIFSQIEYKKLEPYPPAIGFRFLLFNWFPAWFEKGKWDMLWVFGMQKIQNILFT